MHARLLRLAFTVCALWCQNALHAQDAVGVEQLAGTLKKVRDTGTVVIGHRDASVPFSYLNANRRPIGYSIDLCLAIVEQMKSELGMSAIQVKYFPVNSQT